MSDEKLKHVCQMTTKEYQEFLQRDDEIAIHAEQVVLTPHNISAREMLTELLVSRRNTRHTPAPTVSVDKDKMIANLVDALEHIYSCATCANSPLDWRDQDHPCPSASHNYEVMRQGRGYVDSIPDNPTKDLA